MTYSYIGESFARGRFLPHVREFPLRLLVNVTDADLARTIEWCVSECAALLRPIVTSE